jgi:hypothetical protein
MKHSGRRRGFTSWFVEPYRQVKLGLMFLLLNLVFAGLIFGLFGYYVWDIYQTLAVYFNLTTDQSAEIMQKFQTPIYAGTFLLMFFVVVSILISVRYTYQIYGPLVSIHRFLDEYLQGDVVQPLILRQSDQLQELAEKLNQVMYLNPNDRRASNLRPIYRYLDDLLEGAIPEPLALRDGDQFHPLADRVNRLGQKLREERVG